MTKSNIRFYEKMYKKGRKALEPTGLMGRLYLLLKRFELHRRDAAGQLLETGQKILDIGCGDGELLLIAREKGYQIAAGVDLSENVIKNAKENIIRQKGSLSGFNIKKGDVDDKLPFADSSFDAVTMISVLEHVFDPYHAVLEVKRVLKKNGTFILEVPNIAWFHYRFSLLFGKLPQTAYEIGWDGGHLHYFTFATVEKLLKENGFVVLERKTSGIFTPLRLLYPSLLGANVIIKARKK